MQNKLLKIARMGLALAILSFGALPVMAQDCKGWIDDNVHDFDSSVSVAFWKNTTSEQIQTCLDNGADIKTRDGYGFTLLHYATRYSKIPEITKVFLGAGLDVNVRSYYGFTPLHFAAGSNESTEVIKVLLDAGADLNVQNKDEPLLPAGLTPLHMAAGFNANPEIIILLLKAGADGKITTIDGMTAFDWAENNEAIKSTEVYWALNDAQYK